MKMYHHPMTGHKIYSDRLRSHLYAVDNVLRDVFPLPVNFCTHHFRISRISKTALTSAAELIIAHIIMLASFWVNIFVVFFAYHFFFCSVSVRDSIWCTSLEKPVAAVKFRFMVTRWSKMCCDCRPVFGLVIINKYILYKIHIFLSIERTSVYPVPDLFGTTARRKRMS